MWHLGWLQVGYHPAYSQIADPPCEFPRHSSLLGKLALTHFFQQWLAFFLRTNQEMVYHNTWLKTTMNLWMLARSRKTSRIFPKPTSPEVATFCEESFWISQDLVHSCWVSSCASLHAQKVWTILRMATAGCRASTRCERERANWFFGRLEQWWRVKFSFDHFGRGSKHSSAEC